MLFSSHLYRCYRVLWFVFLVISILQRTELAARVKIYKTHNGDTYVEHKSQSSTGYIQLTGIQGGRVLESGE